MQKRDGQDGDHKTDNRNQNQPEHHELCFSLKEVGHDSCALTVLHFGLRREHPNEAHRRHLAVKLRGRTATPDRHQHRLVRKIIFDQRNGTILHVHPTTITAKRTSVSERLDCVSVTAIGGGEAVRSRDLDQLRQRGAHGYCGTSGAHPRFSSEVAVTAVGETPQKRQPNHRVDFLTERHKPTSNGEVEGPGRLDAAGAQFLPAPAATLPRITDPSNDCWADTSITSKWLAAIYQSLWSSGTSHHFDSRLLS